jgi:hypothetical protein
MTTTTTRAITFGAKLDPTNRTLVTHIETLPAGTAVHVKTRRDGKLVARVRGSLLEQNIRPADVKNATTD